jgi:chromosome segregation ATPase
MTSRSEAAEKLLGEARANLRERDAEIRGLEQRALENSLAVKSKDATLADLEKDLASARALHAEVESVRGALDQRSADLAKALEAKDAALKRAEQKIVTAEARISEQSNAMEAERASFAESLAKLKEQLEGEQAARAFAEGALQAARLERGSRRHEAESPSPTAPAKEPQAPNSDTARDKIARLRG